MNYISSFLDSISMDSKGGCANQLNALPKIEKTVSFRNKRMLLMPLLVLGFLLSNENVFGQTTKTANANGNWSDANTWSPSGVPASNDNVIIDGDQVTVTADALCGSLTFTNGTTSSLTVNSNVTLTVTNAFGIQSNATTNRSATVTGAGTISCGSFFVGTNIGTFTYDGTTILTSTITNLSSTGSLTIIGNDDGSSENRPTFNLQSGTIQVDAVSMTAEGDASSTLSLASGAQSGTLKINGATPFSTAGAGTITRTLNGTSSTIEYNRAGDQTVLNTTYRNLTITDSGVKTTGGAATVTGTLTVNSGATLATATTLTTTNATVNIPGSFQINQGGFASGGAWNYGNTGTLVYNNSSGPYGPIDAGHNYWPNTNGPVNVTVQNGGGINMGVSRTVTGTFLLVSGTNAVQGTALTLNGTTRINGGNFQTTPTYGSSSTLAYNTTYGTSNEWTGGASTPVASGSGVPANVIVESGTVTLGGGRGVPGNITVNNSCGLVLNSTSGDLYIGGNLTNNGSTWTNNTRAVRFVGTGTSVITNGGGTQFFDYLLVEKTSGSVQLSSSGGGTDVRINSTSGDVLQMINSSQLDLNGRTLTLAGAGGNISTNAEGRIITSGISGGTLAISGSKTVTGAGTLIFGSNVTVALSGGLNFGDSKSTINGTLTINSGGFVNTNAPTYATGSTLRYNSGGTYGRSAEWSSTSGAGYPSNVTITGNTTLNVINSVNSYKKAAGNLTVDAGSTFSVADLTVGSSGVGVEFLGNIINDGIISLNTTGSSTTNQRLKGANLNNGSSNTTATINLSGVVGGDLELSGNYVDNANFTANSRAVFFTGTGDQTIGGAALAPFNIDYLIVTKSSGSVQLLKDIETTALTIVSGGVNLGGYVVSGTGSFTLHSGATLTTSHAGGLGASIAVTGTKTFNAGANYVFSGATTAPFPTSGTIGDPASVTIAAAVTLNRDISATSLTVNSTNTLSLSSTADLTVSGNIANAGTINLADGATLVQSSSTNGNSGTGTYSVSRSLGYELNTSINQNRSWYIGSPVSTSASSTFSGNSVGVRLWRHDENPSVGAPQFVQVYGTGTSGSPSNTFTAGKGYLFHSTAAYTATFTGTSINNGDITVPLTYTTTSGASNGFNLVSNPYPSVLSWSSIKESNPGVSLVNSYWLRTYAGGAMVFQTYNGASQQYTGNANGTIGPMQGFWVKADAATNLTFKNSMRTHSAVTYYTPAVNRSIRMNLSNGSYEDVSIVYLREDAGQAFDEYDSEKQLAPIHQLYSLEGTTRLAINGFNNALAKDSVQLGVQIQVAGTYSINASEINPTIEEDIFLEDKITGAYQNLKTTPSYSFTSTQGTFNNRFVLHFAPFVPALPGQTAATAIAMPTSNWPQCNNVTSEDQWHAFTATSEGISIAVNTASTDIVIELQDGTGNVVAQENAVNGIGNETLNFFGLTAGQTYKVGVRNNISSQPTGTYGICVKSLKRGGCDYGAGPYSLCQYYKATWAGSTGVSYTFTFTGTSGPAAGQTFTRTQNSDICVLSTVTPLLPYGSTYDVVISNTYTLTDGAGNTEQVTVPSNNGCQVITMAEPQTTLSNNSSCNNGARFRGAVVSSLPWVCGSNNWRWRFTEVNPLTMQEVGLPIELNRGSASNYLNLGTVSQLQNGKTYAVQTAPMFSYTGTNYNWGPTQYMCIVGAAGMTLEGADATQGAEQGSAKDAVEVNAIENDVLIYATTGQQIKVWTNIENAEINNATVRIYNSTGSLVYTQRMSSSEMIIDLNAAVGLYIVEVGGVKRKVKI
jgi:uncharacterized protein (DUF736 family)